MYQFDPQVSYDDVMKTTADVWKGIHISIPKWEDWTIQTIRHDGQQYLKYENF